MVTSSHLLLPPAHDASSAAILPAAAAPPPAAADTSTGSVSIHGSTTITLGACSGIVTALVCAVSEPAPMRGSAATSAPT
jgi:hypothetical protein